MTTGRGVEFIVISFILVQVLKSKMLSDNNSPESSIVVGNPTHLAIPMPETASRCVWYKYARFSSLRPCAMHAATHAIAHAIKTGKLQAHEAGVII